jgi:hypothetical protein
MKVCTKLTELSPKYGIERGVKNDAPLIWVYADGDAGLPRNGAATPQARYGSHL